MAKFEFEPGVPPDTEVDNQEGLPVRVRMVTIRAHTEKTGNVEEASIWKLTVEKTLSLEQIEKLNLWNAERARRYQALAVALFVSRIDRELFLSSEQQSELTNWMDEKAGPQLATRLANNDQPRQVALDGDQTEKPDVRVNKDLADLFTEPQLEIWKQNFNWEFERLEKFDPLPVLHFEPAVRQ